MDAKKDLKKILLEQSGSALSADMQAELNKPLAFAGISAEDHTFLQTVVSLVENGTIKLFVPETLFNRPVYDALDEMAQGKADYDAVRILPKLREMYQLYTSGQTETYQFEYLVRDIRHAKEDIEQVAGNIFIV